MVDELRGKAKVSPKESVRNVSRCGEKGKSRDLQVRCRCESCGFTGPQIPAGFGSARIAKQFLRLCNPARIAGGKWNVLFYKR